MLFNAMIHAESYHSLYIYRCCMVVFNSCL